jgi:superfamily II helicase
LKLGEELKNITKTVKTRLEYNKLQKLLYETAFNGKDIVDICDFKNDYPIIFNSGDVWSWLKDNDIQFTGGLVGAKYSYTLWWQ